MARWNFVTVVLLLAGCSGMPKLWESGPGDPADNFKISLAVNSLSAPEAPTLRKYFLAPGNDGITQDDLQFKEFAAYVERAMRHNGFTLAPPDEADIAVVVAYGIGEPQTHVRTRNIPIWGQTGVASSHTTVTGYGRTATANTYNTPSYGITGVIQKTETETSFTRHIVLAAYDWKEYQAKQRELQVWKTTLTSQGTSADLRMVFPVMLGGAMSSIGRTTPRILTGEVGDMDEPVLVVKGQATPAQ